MDMSASGTSLGIRWYAVSTKSRHEKVAATTLGAVGVEHFLPLYEEERSWSDRKQLVQLPLFPGYLFVHIDPWSGMKLQVLKSPGIAGFVGNQGGPLAIPDEEIEAIQTLTKRGAALTPHPFPQSGDRVRVVRGSLAGVEGTIVRGTSQSRLVISIEAIQRSIAVQMAMQDVVLLSNQATDRADLRGDATLAGHGIKI